VSVNKFIGTIAKYGGMSFSNNYQVKILNLDSAIVYQDADEIISLFCDEAQLPNTNTAQGQYTGIYVGSGQVSYPHTRVYTEIQLGFMLDANLSALKILNKWMDYIFSGGSTEYSDQQVNKSLAQMTAPKLRERNRTIKLNYKDDYAKTMLISKTELGPYSPNQRVPITYVLEEAYPYAIDAVPLSYGNSQITKVSAQFSYARHYTIPNNITSVVGTLGGMYNDSQKKLVQQRVVPGSKK
jgi:hypothetical protein